jgi:hypothetical protein
MERLDSVPAALRAAANDPAVMDIVSDVCKENGLNDEGRVLMVKQLVGIVILGFVRSPDLAKEIDAALELRDPKLAASVAAAIDEEIFSEIKDELANNYRPVGSPGGGVAFAASPKIAQGVPSLIQGFDLPRF